jgi:hypothetical protein
MLLGKRLSEHQEQQLMLDIVQTIYKSGKQERLLHQSFT